MHPFRWMNTVDELLPSFEKEFKIKKTIWIERHFVKTMFNTVRTNGAGIF